MSDPRRFEWLLRPPARDDDVPVSAEARFVDAYVELPPAERSAFAFSEIGGLEAEEIGVRLGTDAETAERLVARARESIRVALAERSHRGRRPSRRGRRQRVSATARRASTS